jgi:two-component system phosphate regulon sensor histidine kinase PhoR
MQKQLNDHEALLKAMKHGVLLVNRTHQVVFFNQVAAAVLELEVYKRKLPERLVDLIEKAFIEKETVEGELETRISGEKFFFQVSVQPLHLPNSDKAKEKQGASVLVELHEITRLHRLENLRREFVANVSHELKTPITSIKAAVETLQDGAVHDQVNMPRFLEIISRQSDRLNTIIEDLLSLSRLENEGNRVLLTTGSIAKVIQEAANTCTIKAKQKNIEILTKAPASLNVKMNAALVEQAIVNLIDNAVKYSEKGTKIQIIAQQTKNEVEISVHDQGHGIAEEHHARIFERFYRVDKARSRSAGGSGLGLSIVKHIAQVHGGRALVQSVLGKGSTFTLILPAG